MPSKGSQRPHEAIGLQPSGGYAPEVDLELTDAPTPSIGGRLGGGWSSDQSINIGLAYHDAPPDGLRLRGPERDDETIETADGDGSEEGEGSPGVERTPDRTYRGDDVAVRLHNVTGLREESAATPGGITTPVGVQMEGHDVSGELGIQRQGRRYYVQGNNLGCSCGQPQCEGRAQATEAVTALMNARRIRSAVGSWERTRTRAASRLAAAAAAEATSRARPERPEPDGPAWADDDNTTAFQEEYNAARERRRAGESPVPFLREDATGGLGARNGGRGFGVEIEFDLSGVTNRAAALRAIGRDLHAAGLTRGPAQTGYHSGRSNGYRQWSFERDSTVDGEIVSPVLYDEPQSWDELAQVCDIVKRHGGTASARTGGHVHVSCGDYDHTVENHNRLLETAAGNEDTLYRLSQNPARRAHRGLAWCRPNRSPSSGYRSIGEVHRYQGTHGVGVNFGSVAGNHTDHVEFRMWDGSLDPGVIQTQISLSLGITDAAFRRDTPAASPEPIGTHRQANARLRRGERLGGQQWKDDTRSFRQLMDNVFWRESNKRQAAALFAVTRWQRSR